MNNSNNIEPAVSEFLKLKQFSELKLLLNSKENELAINDNILNLVDVVCSTVEKYQDDLLNEPANFKSCSDVLTILVEKGNPKEVIIGLLESINKFSDGIYFIQFLLKPIQYVLLLISKREYFFDYVLEVIYTHFNAIPKPENRNLEGEELMLLDLDTDVQKTSALLLEYLEFIKPFVEEVCKESISSTVMYEQLANQRVVLQNYMLKLLNHPLIFQDLHILPDRQMSSVQSSCQKLLIYLSSMQKNLLSLYLFKSLNFSDDYNENSSSDSISYLSYGNLAYLLYAENVLPDRRPYVYSSGYLFEKHMPLITIMFTNENYLVIYKGMHLFKNLLNTDFILPVSDVPLSNFTELPKALIGTATYCTIESYRKLLGTLFISYIKKFSWKARYSILFLLMDVLSDFGVEGTLIDLYRNFLHEARQNENILKYFVGKKLHLFLRKALYLKNGVKTDILENQKRILSGLNTLRYLILTDSKIVNFTGIFDILSELKKTYLDPLQLGIDISKAHYQLEVNNVAKEMLMKKCSVEKTSSVTVGGEILQISPLDHLNAMKQALVSLDLVQSILSSVFEVLHQKTV